MSKRKSYSLHIKLDTGMGRLGIKDTKTYQEVIEIIQQYEQLGLKACLHTLPVLTNQEI